MFLFFRVIQALSGAGAFAIVGGSLSDLWIPEERAQAMSFFAATTLIGPCFGPVLGSLVADNLNWYIISCFVLMLGDGCFIFRLFMRESSSFW
jgi:MFS family permease